MQRIHIKVINCLNYEQCSNGGVFVSVLKGLNPEKIFAYFEELAKIPHGSGNENASTVIIQGYMDMVC